VAGGTAATTCRLAVPRALRRHRDPRRIIDGVEGHPCGRVAWSLQQDFACRRRVARHDERLSEQCYGCRSETDDEERAQKLTTETRSPRRSQGLCCNRAFESKRGQLPNQQQSAPVPSVLSGNSPRCGGTLKRQPQRSQRTQKWVREPEDSGCWFCEPWVFCGSLQADPCPPWLPPFEPGGRRLCWAPWCPHLP
jgi:hypothetical protein